MGNIENTSFGELFYSLPQCDISVFSRPVARRMAVAVVSIDPWASLGYEAASLEAFFNDKPACTHRFVLIKDGEELGALSIKTPWLYGPYIELLAILPTAQKKGIGRAVLNWIEGEVRAGAGVGSGGPSGNLWVAASSFNDNAIGFYEKYGFERVGDLPGLVRPGFTEILFRKQIVE